MKSSGVIGRERFSMRLHDFMKSQRTRFYEVKQSRVSQNAQKMCSAVQNHEKRSETRLNFIKSCSQIEKRSGPLFPFITQHTTLDYGIHQSTRSCTYFINNGVFSNRQPGRLPGIFDNRYA